MHYLAFVEYKISKTFCQPFEITDSNLFFSKKLMIIDISTFIIGIGVTVFSLCFADSLFLGQNQGISRFFGHPLKPAGENY